MIKTIKGGDTKIKIHQNQNKCILHFLDLANINLTKAYLKSAWSAGAVGANDFYLVATETMSHVAHLNFSEIFDFKKLLIATSPKVGAL